MTIPPIGPGHTGTSMSPLDDYQEVYVRFAQPPEFTEETRLALEEFLRSELDQPDLTFINVFPPGDDPPIYGNYWVLKNLKELPGVDAHQIIPLTNTGIDRVSRTSSASTGGVAIDAYRTNVPPEDREDLFVQGAPAALGAVFAHAMNYKGQEVNLCIIERVWNMAVVGKTIFGKEIKDRRDGIEKCLESPAPEYNRWIAHSTATLGIIGVQKDVDATGIHGMAPGADITAISSLTDNPGFCKEDWPGAIELAIDSLGPGDVLLLEGQTCYDPDKPFKLLPLEHDKAIFNAIKAATDKDIIVIEPAGNWGINFESLQQAASLDWLDNVSDAIIVGAYDHENSGVLEGTNSGERINLHAWGNQIATKDPEGALTFHAQTSGAAALIACAAVLVQSAVIAKGKKPLNSLEMRHYLKMSGSAQIEGIGVMPNLERFITEILDTLPAA